MMKELPRQVRSFAAKLITTVAVDFLQAREILVSFPDEWELIRSFRLESLPLNAAAPSWEVEKPSREHFHGLSAPINATLNEYRRLKLFGP